MLGTRSAGGRPVPPSPSNTTMYEVNWRSGAVGTIATVLPVGSVGARATTNSCGDASSRTIDFTPPPGPVNRTSKTRTVWPPTRLLAFGGAENVVVQAVTGDPSLFSDGGGDNPASA